MAQCLTQGLKDMKCAVEDLEVTSLNPGQVKLCELSTSKSYLSQKLPLLNISWLHYLDRLIKKFQQRQEILRPPIQIPNKVNVYTAGKWLSKFVLPDGREIFMKQACRQMQINRLVISVYSSMKYRQYEMRSSPDTSIWPSNGNWSSDLLTHPMH